MKVSQVSSLFCRTEIVMFVSGLVEPSAAIENLLGFCLLLNPTFPYKTKKNKFCQKEQQSPYLHYTARVDLDHVTDASECRIFLLIVSNVAQRSAPTQKITQCKTNPVNALK